MELVSCSTGSNYAVVEVGELTLWFSYRTLIAYQIRGRRCVSENLWGATTGKHLNAIDGGDKKSRCARPLFEKTLADTLKFHGLID